MKDYKVIKEDNITDFIESVNDAISNGYICQGGLSVCRETHNTYFYQAMTK